MKLLKESLPVEAIEKTTILALINKLNELIEAVNHMEEEMKKVLNKDRN